MRVTDPTFWRGGSRRSFLIKDQRATSLGPAYNNRLLQLFTRCRREPV